MTNRAINESFGQRVRVALAVSKVSRTELSRACQVSRMAVQKWCDGICYPSSRNLVILSEMTGASVEWLMWQAPVDIRTTDWAINGQHIKNIVRATIDEISP